MGILNWIKDYLKDIGSSFKKTSKNIVLTSFFWVIIVALALIISMSVMIFNTIHDRPEQNMAKYWQNKSETDFRQLSVFAKGEGYGSAPKTAPNSEDYLTLDSVKTIRESLDSKIADAKKNANNKKKDKNKDKNQKKNWTDCYSTTFDTSGTYIKSRIINNKTEDYVVSFSANIVAVGGDFAVFHPFEYLSGGFLPTDEFNANLCVINDSLAWQLFKSYDVTNLKINILGEDYVIVGVVHEDETSINKLSGCNDNRVFVFFSKMADLNDEGMFLMGGSTEETQIDPLAITCYEVMLPEMVRGVAKSDVMSSLPSYNSSDPQFVITSNTGRFNIGNIYDENMPIGSSEKKYSGYDLPYWEKAARLSLERLFIEGAVLIVGIILLFIGVIITILRFSKVNKTRTPEVDDIFAE